MSAATIKLIHVGCRSLGIDEETRRDLCVVTTGKESLRAMSDRELDAVVDALKAKGFKPTAGRKRAVSRPFASRGDVRFCHVLWAKLVRAGVMATPGALGLNAFVRARFEKTWGAVPIDVDQMRDWKQIAAVIEALKQICKRNAIETEKQ